MGYYLQPPNPADPNNPPNGWEWLRDVFTDEEIASLTAIYSYETGKFEGVGFVNIYGKFCSPVETDKLEALERMEQDYRNALKQV